MTVRPMTLSDLEEVLGWAAAEGWNPGREDPAAFLAADPAGFLVKEVAGRLVAAVSVVNHDAQNAFLGLYLCRPEARGQGHGWEVWCAGRAHAGTRVLGLDGVPAQQDNYIRDGFSRHDETMRYSGTPQPAAPGMPAEAEARDLDALLEMDRAANGYGRPHYMTAWFTAVPTRRTYVIRRAGRIAAYATARKCREGTKIGPLHAETVEDARTLLAAGHSLGGAPVFVDVPQAATALHAELQFQRFEPVFGTARMYSAAPPPAKPPGFHAVTTLELG